MLIWCVFLSPALGRLVMKEPLPILLDSSPQPPT